MIKEGNRRVRRRKILPNLLSIDYHQLLENLSAVECIYKLLGEVGTGRGPEPVSFGTHKS